MLAPFEMEERLKLLLRFYIIYLESFQILALFIILWATFCDGKNAIAKQK